MYRVEQLLGVAQIIQNPRDPLQSGFYLVFGTPCQQGLVDGGSLRVGGGAGAEAYAGTWLGKLLGQDFVLFRAQLRAVFVP